MEQITADKLNKVAALIGTTDKNTVISAVLATLIGAGMKASEAYDALFGEGAYQALAGDLHDALSGVAA